MFKDLTISSFSVEMDVLKTESKKHKCQKCDKSYKEKGNLNQHFKVAHDGMRFKCNICNKTFSAKHSMEVHKNDKHFDKVGERPKCELCNKEYTKNCHVLRHIREVHKRIKFDCNQCDKTFSVKSYLKFRIWCMKGKVLSVESVIRSS